MDLLSVRRQLDSGRSIFDLSLRAVFYARVSTDRDEQLNSLSNQISYYEDYIKGQRNWTYAGAYIDEGISGTSVNKREDFLRMIQDARDGKFDLIVTKEISRFSRNTLDSIRYTQELLQHGAGVYFQNDNINTLYGDAELRLTIMSSIAQDEVRRLSERVKFGMRRAYENGRVLGQDNLYGYDKRDGKLVINEREAVFVRTLYAMYAEGKYGFRSIARTLTEMGFANQSGGEINPGTLRSILSNPKYKGYYCGRKTESSDYRTQKNVQLPEKDRLYYRDENIAPIVSEELWERVNTMLAQRRDKYKKSESGTQNRYPFSGKIVCERCGTFHYRIVRKDRKNNQEVWSCKMRTQKGKAHCSTPEIGTAELDAILKHIGSELLANKRQVIDELMLRYNQAQTDSVNYGENLIKLYREAEKVMAKKESLLDYSLEGAISKDDFKSMNERLEKSLQKTRVEIAQLEKEQEINSNAGTLFKKLERQLTVELEETSLPLDIARNMLERITVSPESTREHVKLRFLMHHGREHPALIEKLNILYRHTEVSPIVGTEKQSEELVRYLLSEFESDPASIWGTNMFGKSLEELVKEGLSNKLMRMPEDVQAKIQQTLQRIINDGSGGLICILL